MAEPGYRPATANDLAFLIEIDRLDEGVSSSRFVMSYADQDRHAAMIAAFIDDENKAAWICEIDGKTIGAIMWRYRNRLSEELPSYSVFNHISVDHFPKGGAFCEIFQLWVEPSYRRRGIGTRLKQLAEAASLSRGVTAVYTHTESRNQHVIDLNLNLGYKEVRRGPIWDEIERVSLIKHLDPQPGASE